MHARTKFIVEFDWILPCAPGVVDGTFGPNVKHYFNCLAVGEQACGQLRN